MLTVCCVLVHGEYPFTPDYVRRLLAMVRHYCNRPFRFVCLTDQPDAMPDGVEPIAIEKLPECFALWSKLHVFDQARRWRGRVLYLDLDLLIVKSLAPIIDYPEAFVLVSDALAIERAHPDRDRYGRRLVRRFNSSVMVWNAGDWTWLFDAWTPAVSELLSTDQDWIGYTAGHVARGMPLSWFPRISQVSPPWSDETKVILCKKPKNHEAVKRWDWFEPLWGGAAA